MRVALRSLLVCVLVCVLGGSLLVSGSLASEALGGEAPTESSLLGESFAAPEMQLLDGGEQARAAAEARRLSPAAAVAREESQSKYAGLSGVRAARLAQEAFPALIGEPAGGPPNLPAGESIVGFPAVNVARVDRGGGKHGVIESSAPMAVEPAQGQRVPIDLSLTDVGSAFEPKMALARIRVPKQLGDGVVLSGSGVSLTPVDAQGAPLGGSEGSVDETTVFYPNTQTDADTMVKPTTFGFNVDTQLRSETSPRQLEYRVGLPQGASLVQEKGEGLVRVVDMGQTLAVIAPPTAHDAEGTLVPVSMSMSGDVLSVAIAPFAGYRLPIEVDPTVEDRIWQNEWNYGTYYRTEWHFVHYGAGFGAPDHPEGGSWTESIYYGHYPGEWGGLFYTTRGESQITLAHAEGHWNDSGSHIQNYMLLETGKSPYLEDYDPMPEATGEGGWGGYACAPALGCPETIAGEAAPENNNTAGYKQLAYGNGEGHSGENTITKAYVDISQEKGPELEFNKTSSTIYNESTKEYIPNVLYGSSGWLGPHSGAFEVRAKDPGLGLSLYRLLTSGWGDYEYYYALGDCVGLQCPVHNGPGPEGTYQGYTYKTGMPDGETSFEALAEDPAGLFADIYPQKIKVDATPPRNIKIVGFQNGNELPMGETHLKVEATDGEGTTKSSGIKSIKVSVDGHEVTGSTATCPEGPCTANTESTLIARDYTSGQHAMVVTATDNASNVAQEEFTFRVGGASPVSVGPGSVDPSDGQFTLNATDVSLGGTSGVSRTYQSRSLTTGAEGPLGPQWAISTGGGEGLTLLSNGNAVLNAANGANTMFTLNKKGEYESPSGDSNLKLEPKEKVPGKGITEYILTDPTTGAKTKFEQPSTALNTTPVFSNQFGAEAGQLKHPLSDAVDSAGNVWVTSNESDLVEKFSSTGVLEATYGSQGTGEKQFIGPWGIAIDPRNGNVYVSDQANSRVEELSSTGAFIKVFGWGVGKAAKAEFEICTTECKAGLAGAGNGQFSAMAGLAVDTSGNVLVADFGNNRVQEFNEKGEYVKKFGTVGKGAEQFEGPLNIAIYGSDLYITDYHNNRVQEFTTSGTHVKVFGEAGSENGKFSNPYGIAVDPRNGNVYVVDSGNHRVQQFSSAGTFITKFGSSGTGAGQFTTPIGISIGSSGGIYVVDNGANSLDAWGRPLWLPSETGGALAASATTYAYTAVESEGQTIMQPTEALAPIPAGVSSCSPLVAGCRSLTFEYGKETTAKGEKSSEWGNYKGRLEKVWFHGYSPSAKEMIKAEVGRYEYDNKGRLRTEWDPRLEHALKTTYGYDTEGHVTALTPPGQESWVFTYGTIAGDSNEGRLLKVTRAPASASLWNGQLPVNTAVPALSGTTVVGVKMGVSNGTWSNGPVAYAYQWKDCNSSGGECKPILGATNANYTLQSSDVGHKVVAQVQATNGGGTVAAVSAASGVVTSTGTKTEGTSYSPGPGSTIEYGVLLSGTGLPTLTKGEVEKWGQKDSPVEGSAIFPPDEPQGWPASAYTRATIHYWDSNGRSVNTDVPTKGIATSEYNKANETIRSLSANNRAAAMKEGCISVAKKECRSAEISEKLDTRTEYNPEETEIVKVLGPEHEIKLSTGSEVEAREVTHDYYNQGAQEAEEKNKETYNLLTRTTDGALLTGGEEKDVRTTISSYNGQKDLGWTLRKPTSVITDPAGLKLTHRMTYDPVTGNPVEVSSPAAETSIVSYSSQFGSKGAGNGQLKEPKDVALDLKGNIWVLDTANHRVQEFSAAGAYLSQFGSYGSGNGQFNEPKGMVIDSKSNIWVSDQANNCLQEFNEKGEFIRKVGTSGSGNGQFSSPQGLATDSKNDVWVADRANNRVEELNEIGAYLAQFGTNGSGNGQFKEPMDIGIDSHSNIFVLDIKNSRVQEFNTKLEYVSQFGSAGSGPAQVKEPKGLAVDQAGNVWVADSLDARLEEFSESGEYLGQAGSEGTGNGQFQEPRGIAINSKGTVWVVDVIGDRVQQFAPGSPHTTRTIYYTAKSEAEVSTCQNHPEWAGLSCLAEPAAQPDRGLPELPVTTVTYNVWDEAEATTEKYGSGSGAVTRTKAQTYDPAGRALTSEETSSPTTGTSLPKVTNEYNTATGLLEKQSTPESAITTKYNKLGQMIEYADASGNVAKYTYEEGSDGRLTEISEGKGKEAESYQTYSYDPTTGFLTKLVDSAAGTFTASYDLEGKMTSEVYPNKMTATYTVNPIGKTTGLVYEKNAHCASTCPETWFSDSVSASIHGETLQQTSTLSKENYAYDNTGQLLETQETPAGKGCVTRLYAYDEESNRTSLTTREPGTEGKCATEGGTVERHTYDEANRLTDEKVTYEPFGNITKVPASDAGGHELTSTYYVDGQVASQEQNKQLIGYKYDPAGRTTEAASENTETKAKTTLISHYAGTGGALTWTSEGTEKWTRNIPGIDGSLSAIQESSGAIALELHDLQGDIVGKASVSETETKLLSTYNSTEFGVPTTTNPPKYSWLGADGVASELTATGVSTQNGSSYVPEIGRPLQTGPIASPGSFPEGTAGVGVIEAPYLGASNGQLMNIAIQESAEREEAKRREAEEIAKMNECPASECGPWPEEGGAESVEAEEYDPNGLASYKTTLNRAKELRNDAVKGGVSGLVLDLLFPGAADAGAEYALGLEVSAASLDSCVEVGKQTSGKRGKWGTCFIHENKLLGIPVSAEAEFCGYEETRSWGKKTHSYYYCEGSGELISGPWY
jgi:DNA-binding beta-propeller fold protein YncE